MEFRFELPDGYSKADWKAFFRTYYRINPGARWGHLLVRALCAAAGLLNFLLLVGILVSEESRPLAALVPAVLFLAALVYSVGFPSLLIWSSRRRTAAAGQTMTVSITDGGVTDRTGGITTHYRYDAFCGIYDCRDRYLLFVSKKSALILPERCREGGSSPELRRFLEEKTGLTVRTIQ